MCCSVMSKRGQQEGGDVWSGRKSPTFMCAGAAAAATTLLSRVGTALTIVRGKAIEAQCVTAELGGSLGSAQSRGTGPRCTVSRRRAQERCRSKVLGHCATWAGSYVAIAGCEQ